MQNEIMCYFVMGSREKDNGLARCDDPNFRFRCQKARNLLWVAQKPGFSLNKTRQFDTWKNRALQLSLHQKKS